MTRRFLMGRYDGKFRVRASRAGVDARTANLTQLLFDSDSIPVLARPIAQTQVLGTGVAPAYTAGGRSPPLEKTIAHGLGFTPIVLAIAKPIGGPWYYTVFRKHQIGNGTPVEQWMHDPIQNPAMHDGAGNGKWTTPFWLNGTLSNGAPYFIGWWWNADSTNVIFRSDNVTMDVRYAFLEP